MDTDTRDESVTTVQVACSVCQHEVPVSEALSFEASDYVAHFCGLECYRRWMATSQMSGDDTF